jgi:hypothetical protein
MTAPSTTGTSRANRDGHPCPPWCQTDHDEILSLAGHFLFHGGPPADIELTGKTSAPDKITARAFHVGDPRFEAVVSVAALRHGTDGQQPHLWLTPGDAGDLAGLVDMLAGATPARHRELAAAIRRAAAVITDGG